MSPDWNDYEPVHADRSNLCIHLLAVPLFAIALPTALILLAKAEYIPAIASLLVTIASLVAQGVGHAKESVPPRPLKGPGDFLKRWLSEQYFIFPAFVLTRRWWRQYQAAAC